MNHEVWVWQFDTDYPGAVADDGQLPIARVIVKGADGAYYQSTFDGHPAAISGPEAAARMRDTIYAPQGIFASIWVVPHGVYPGYGPWPDAPDGERTDYAFREGRMHGRLAVAAARPDEPKVLTVDLEPYYYDSVGGTPQYWRKDLGAGPEQVHAYLDGAASAGVQYVDIAPVVRRNPFALWDTDFAAWCAHPLVSRVCPQVYWTAFGCSVTEAFDELWTGLARVGVGWPPERIRPLLPGDASPDELAEAWDYAQRHGLDRPMIWRRGLLSAAAWDRLRTLTWPAAAPEPPPPPPPPPPVDIDGARAHLDSARNEIEAARRALG